MPKKHPKQKKPATAPSGGVRKGAPIVRARSGPPPKALRAEAILDDDVEVETSISEVSDIIGAHGMTAD